MRDTQEGEGEVVLQLLVAHWYDRSARAEYSNIEIKYRSEPPDGRRRDDKSSAQ